MVEASRRPLRFESTDILRGLTYHFRELGIGRSLEEGLVEIIERRMAERRVLVHRQDWATLTDDLERAGVLLEIAQVERSDLEASPQGIAFLFLASRRSEVIG